MSVKEWNGFQYEIAQGGMSINGRRKGIIRRMGGTWPSDDDLITLMDGDEPPNVRHFGGFVEGIDSRLKQVTVYTD